MQRTSVLFSGAGKADDAEDFALLDLQVDLVQGVNSGFSAAKDLAQVLDLNDGFAHNITTPFEILGISGKIKKSLKLVSLKDERTNAPWYHLGSHAFSRRRP